MKTIASSGHQSAYSRLFLQAMAEYPISNDNLLSAKQAAIAVNPHGTATNGPAHLNTTMLIIAHAPTCPLSSLPLNTDPTAAAFETAT